MRPPGGNSRRVMMGVRPWIVKLGHADSPLRTIDRSLQTTYVA
jgi:hypothetical protein